MATQTYEETVGGTAYEEQPEGDAPAPEIKIDDTTEMGDTHRTKRQRWATSRLKGKDGVQKRRSILKRFHIRSGSQALENEGKNVDGSSIQDGDETQRQQRTVYFNMPLPDSARDDEGHPKETFVRNKIRTAKYTPLSFIPKNLFFQFHNIANIYFLFIIILSVGAVNALLLAIADDQD